MMIDSDSDSSDFDAVLSRSHNIRVKNNATNVLSSSSHNSQNNKFDNIKRKQEERRIQQIEQDKKNKLRNNENIRKSNKYLHEQQRKALPGTIQRNNENNIKRAIQNVPKRNISAHQRTSSQQQQKRTFKTQTPRSVLQNIVSDNRKVLESSRIPSRVPSNNNNSRIHHTTQNNRTTQNNNNNQRIQRQNIPSQQNNNRPNTSYSNKRPSTSYSNQRPNTTNQRPNTTNPRPNITNQRPNSHQRPSTSQRPSSHQRPSTSYKSQRPLNSTNSSKILNSTSKITKRIPLLQDSVKKPTKRIPLLDDDSPKKPSASKIPLLQDSPKKPKCKIPLILQDSPSDPSSVRKPPMTPSDFTTDDTDNFPIGSKFLSTKFNDFTDTDDSSEDIPLSRLLTRGGPSGTDDSSDSDDSSSDALLMLRKKRKRGQHIPSFPTTGRKKRRTIPSVSPGTSKGNCPILSANEYKSRPIVALASRRGAVKWWDTEPYKGDQKWTTLDHNGVVFPPDYEQHHVLMKYNKKEIKLTPLQEECASWFAAILETEHAKNPVFQKNFFDGFKKLLRAPRAAITHPEVTEFEKCDFRPIYDWCVEEKDKLKILRKDPEFKAKRKKEKEEWEALYGWAVVDGIREKLGAAKVEPPGLFRGRGKHPKTGMIKNRLTPEDIIINIGPGIPIPKCPIEGHQWGGICHDNTVTYIAKWIENINGSHKMVYLHSSSRFKGESDRKKFNKARRLKKYIKGIRGDYTRKLLSLKMYERQLATAVWMIDILSIRVGNEKDTDEAADTVGVCSLRVEHIKLLKESMEVEFDFLGKDSMRYYNKVKFPELVFRNMIKFVKNKAPTDDLLQAITPEDVNVYLKSQMSGLSAKVFRTYNASITLEKELEKAFTGEKIEVVGKLNKKSSTDDKVYFYNQANKRVAILCNHQKSVSKTFDEQMEKMDEKLKDKKLHLKQLKKDLQYAKGKKAPPKDWRKKNEQQVLNQIKKTGDSIHKIELNVMLKAENKEVSLGTSKINYMDPRITVAFCKKMELPIEKIFSKSLMDKFPWACAEAPAFRF